MKYKKNLLKTIKEEYENKFNDYRDIDDEEMEKYINKKSGDLPTRQLLQQLSLNDLLWDVDAASLYPSAMRDENTIYPRIETGCAFTKDMNDEIVKIFNQSNFTQGSAICAILKIKFFTPKK